MTLSKPIHIVIPTFNRINYLVDCIHSIHKQTYNNYKIIVVDDNSSDNTSEIIKTRFKDTIVLLGTGSLWWTGATNKGCGYALENGAELILTLNDDLVLAKNYLAEMIKAHHQKPNALIGSLSISLEKTPRLLDAGCISHNYWTAKTKKRGRLMAPYEYKLKGLLPTLTLPGRGTLIPAEVFYDIGLFDDKNFPQYAADNDFALRAKKSHYDLLVNTAAILFSHYECTGTGNFGLKEDWVTFLKSFITFNSPNYLPVSLKYEYRHYPFKPYFPMYFMLSSMRKIGSFIKRMDIS